MQHPLVCISVLSLSVMFLRFLSASVCISVACPFSLLSNTPSTVWLYHSRLWMDL